MGFLYLGWVGVLLLTMGCATQSWVREELATRPMGAVDPQQLQRLTDTVTSLEARLDGLDARLRHEARTTSERVDAVEGMLPTMSEGARDARARADVALASAEATLAYTEMVDSRLTRLWANRYATKVGATVHVQFGFGRVDLDEGAQAVLAGLVKAMQARPSSTVVLFGSTDAAGSRWYNEALSHRRVDAVRQYLFVKGIQLGRIEVLALGALGDGTVSEEHKRRVVARLMVDAD